MSQLSNTCQSFRCDNESSHTVYKDNKKHKICCKCYVQKGGEPNKWHRGCLRETRKLEIKENGCD